MPSEGVPDNSLESLGTIVEKLATQRGLECVRQPVQSPHGTPEIWVKMSWNGLEGMRDINIRIKSKKNQLQGTIYVDGNIMNGPNIGPFVEASLSIGQV